MDGGEKEKIACVLEHLKSFFKMAAQRVIAYQWRIINNIVVQCESLFHNPVRLAQFTECHQSLHLVTLQRIRRFMMLTLQIQQHDALARGLAVFHPENKVRIEAALSVEAAATLGRRSISTSEPSANDGSCWVSAASQRLTRATIAARTF